MYPTTSNTFDTLSKYNQQATKYILNDSTSDYKSQLIQTQLLPLTYILDLNDVMLLLRIYKLP